MSYQVFFALSQGLAKSIIVPKGTKVSIAAHIAEIEAKLGLKPVQNGKNAPRWSSRDFPSPDIATDVLCKAVDQHNAWVRRFYDQLGEWSANTPVDGEELTPDDAKTFWHGLEILRVPPQRWSGDYYRARMEELYEVMRGRPTAGISFGVQKLLPRQAGAVIRLFEEWLDPQDLRLEVPKGCDYLASSYYGEYDWCEKCGAVEPEYANECNKRVCPVRDR